MRVWLDEKDDGPFLKRGKGGLFLDDDSLVEKCRHTRSIAAITIKLCEAISGDLLGVDVAVTISNVARETLVSAKELLDGENLLLNEKSRMTMIGALTTIMAFSHEVDISYAGRRNGGFSGTLNAMKIFVGRKNDEDGLGDIGLTGMGGKLFWPTSDMMDRLLKNEKSSMGFQRRDLSVFSSSADKQAKKMKVKL